ncbi:hypothetical protein, conserved [Babesia ovata]|uniref:SAP domain-containing protein n=1 Tax=Babesia ovata TaxID=189622 RepID=A0A2H6K8T7_9APIC|nr:uncharacterized protein BOVATA_008960 [Babesia ovata]GBE59403.1 hypothetical protein, conserved [Babesia ovata]
MRAIPQLYAMCFVANPPGGGFNYHGRSTYVERHFGCRLLSSKSQRATSSVGAQQDSKQYGGMLDGPYYNQDFEEAAFSAAIDDMAEEDGSADEMDDIERQLLEARCENELYNRLNRMVRRSAEFEMPKTYVETQAMYPPGRPDDEAANRKPDEIRLKEYLSNRNATGAENIRSKDQLDADTTIVTAVSDCNEPLETRLEQHKGRKPQLTDEEIERTRAEVPPLKSQFDEYAPIKLPANANTTSELISGIIQMPDIKDKKFLQESIKIKDYSEPSRPPLDEDEVWLRGINEERAKRGEPELRCAEGEKLSDNAEFIREKRALELREVRDIRRIAHEARENREALKHTFYRKLPRNNMGFAELKASDIGQLSFQEVKEELRARGYRTSGGEKMARLRLEHALTDSGEWRYRNIVTQPLDETNENLPQTARERIADLKQKVKFINESGWGGDMVTTISRLRAKNDLIKFHDDPVGYLGLDMSDPSQQISPEEAEELRNAPVVHDTAFIKAMQDPINRLPDIIPRTFNLQHDVERPYPRYAATHKAELEDMKREYLSFKGGIHEETLPEISQRFEISLDFLGDACCRLGAQPPVALDMPLRGIISYSAIWDLAEFLNIADTLEVEAFYSILNIKEVAAELGKTVKEVEEACESLNIKLPFGAETKLNLHCLLVVEKLLKTPDLDVDLLAQDPSYRNRFRDPYDNRPYFPNSMRDDIHREAIEKGALFEQPEFHGDEVN